MSAEGGMVVDKPLVWIEADPLPDECLRCKEAKCYNCDFAGKRWYLSVDEDIRLRKKGLLHTINRLEQKLKADIDDENRSKSEDNLARCKQILREDFGEEFFCNMEL